MSYSCPKCRFSNPWGAEICGECGFTLMAAKEKNKKEEQEYSQKIYSHLTPKNKRSVPLGFRIVGYVLFINAILLMGISFIPYFLPFRGDYVFSFILLFLCLGSLGFIVSTGFLKARHWILSAYSMWVAIKIFLYVLLWAGLLQFVPSSWLTSNRMSALLVVLIGEIALIPYVLVTTNRLKREEEKYKYLE